MCVYSIFTSGAWYRLDGAGAGYIPDGSLQFGYCGTYHPIWMHGQHPTEGITK